MFATNNHFLLDFAIRHSKLISPFLFQDLLQHFPRDFLSCLGGRSKICEADLRESLNTSHFMMTNPE